MTTEEKAKAYDNALKRIREFYLEYDNISNLIDVKRELESIFPQLCESEDEKTRKRLIEFISDIKRISESGRTYWAIRKEDAEMCNAFLAYLEKQKEQKPAEINEYEIIKKHITEDLLSSEVNKRLKECGWYVTEQKPINNSTREKIISRATSEKQVVLISESSGNAEIGWDTRSLEDAKKLLEYGLAFINKSSKKPAEKQDYSGLTDLERAIHRGFLSAGVENVPVTIIKETAKECKRTQTIANENANAEWSEEDEDIRDTIIYDLKRLGGDIANVKPAYKKEIDWLKSLRPQHHQTDEDKSISKEILEYFNEKKDYRSRWYAWVKYASRNPHWKPSEEQIATLEKWLKDKQFDGASRYVYPIFESLYEQLQKLM